MMEIPQSGVTQKRLGCLSLIPVKVFSIFHIKGFCLDNAVFVFLNRDLDLDPGSVRWLLKQCFLCYTNTN